MKKIMTAFTATAISLGAFASSAHAISGNDKKTMFGEMALTENPNSGGGNSSPVVAWAPRCEIVIRCKIK